MKNARRRSRSESRRRKRPDGRSRHGAGWILRLPILWNSDSAPARKTLLSDILSQVRNTNDPVRRKMPIYEYKCRDCGRITEAYIPVIKQDISLSCSHCQSKNLEKIFSTPSSVRMGNSSSKGSTCCGRTERCDTPPCSDGGVCRRD